MPDQSLDILIRTLAETHGADEVSKALARIKTETGEAARAESAASDATSAALERKNRVANDAGAAQKILARSHEEAGRAAEGQTRRIAGLDRALNLLARQFGALGTLVRFAFKDPVALLVASLAIGIQRVSQAFARLSEAVRNTSAAVAASLGDLRGSARETLLEFIRANTALKELETETETRARAATTAIEAQRDALLTLLDAHKAVALAAATDDAQRAAVEQQFASARDEIQLRASAETIAARQLEIERKRALLAAETARAQAALGNLGPMAAEAQARDIPKQRQSLAELEKTLREELAFFDKMSPGETFAAVAKFGSAGDLLAHVQGLRELLEKTTRSLASLETREKQLTEGITARAAADALAKDVAALESELAAIRTRFESRTQARAIEDFGRAPEIIERGGAALSDFKAGKTLDKSQLQAVKDLQRLAAELGWDYAGLVNFLSQTTDTMAAVRAAIDAANKRIAAIEARSPTPAFPGPWPAPAPVAAPPTAPPPAVIAPPTVPPPAAVAPPTTPPAPVEATVAPPAPVAATVTPPAPVEVKAIAPLPVEVKAVPPAPVAAPPTAPPPAVIAPPTVPPPAAVAPPTTPPAPPPPPLPPSPARGSSTGRTGGDDSARLIQQLERQHQAESELRQILIGFAGVSTNEINQVKSRLDKLTAEVRSGRR